MVQIVETLNATVRNAKVRIAAIRIAAIQIEATQNAVIHDAARIVASPNVVILSSVSPIAATQVWFRVVIRVAPFSVQNAARNAVSLPASLVQDAPHEVS